MPPPGRGFARVGANSSTKGSMGGRLASVRKFGSKSDGEVPSTSAAAKNRRGEMMGRQKKSGGSKRAAMSKALSFRKAKPLMDLDAVTDALDRAVDASTTLQQRSNTQVEYYYHEDVKVGKLVEAGQFYDLYKVKSLPDLDEEESEDNSDEFNNGEVEKKKKKKQLSSSSLNFCSDNTTSRTHYVIKKLNKKYSTAKGVVHQATLRLVLEAMYLSRLDHVNIAKIKGVPVGEEDALVEDYSASFFMIREQITEALENRLERWITEAKTPTSSDLRRKLRYAGGLADALRYLHEKKIIVLNLSPQTVGFTADGTMQIMDLSCCREVTDDESEKEDDTNKFINKNIFADLDAPEGFDFAPPSLDTAAAAVNGAQNYDKTNFLVMSASTDAGFPRYVAPEAILNGKYTSHADTYSWALIFYELLTLSKPYANFKSGQHMTKVCMEGQRPNLTLCKLPKQLTNLIEKSWRHTYQKRPPASALLEAIKTLLPAKKSDTDVRSPPSPTSVREKAN